MHRPPSSDHRARFLPRLNRMLGEVDVLLVAVAVGLAVTRLVTDAASIYAEILGVADIVVVGSHRPAIKDYLLCTDAACVVRHARCSVLVAGD